MVAPEPGLQEQVIDGETGVVARTTDGVRAAQSRACSTIGTLRARYGENGRQHVAERFLITRYLRDYLDDT